MGEDSFSPLDEKFDGCESIEEATVMSCIRLLLISRLCFQLASEKR